ETKKEVFDRRLAAGIWGSRFKEWVYAPSRGRSGGIAVMWNSQTTSISDFEIGEFSVSIRILDASGGDWWLSGIYGPCHPRDRRRFWEELAGLFGLCGNKWCIGGDFNVVRFVSEKSNGGRMTSSMKTFNDFIDDTNLRDPNLLNASFTWSNFRENAVCRRLDRFLFSEEWEDSFPHVKHTALARVTSDHCPIMLDTSILKWGPGPFRFENIRLRTIKQKIKVWNKEVFGDLVSAKKEAEARIAALDLMEGQGGLDNTLRKEREDLYFMVSDLVHKEEVKWRQRGKIQWARDGDSNTKFFHRIASGRRKRNFIQKLEVAGGGVVVSEGEIELEIINFFKNLYSSNVEAGWCLEGLNWNAISVEEAEWLDRPFEEEEVKRAVFDCGIDKSPGPDGFSMLLFQSCWDIVKEDLMKVMADFFNCGIINAITNETFICLIPKKKESVKVSDFRPISLVTSLYKMVSKVLASRLREVLGSTISSYQSAFVQGRQILDAALIANEVVEESRRLNKSGMVFKIDLEKAYDHVEWRFVDEVLIRKGFGDRWRSWIRGCLETANFSVMINGRPRGKFRASRGLRQGDPLSPFLFTLVMDVLSRIMEKAQDADEFHGLSPGNGMVEISHLQFADDTIFFIEDKEEYWNNLLQILELFCFVSGMTINKSKCSLVGINLDDGMVNEMAGAWGCDVGVWPMLYLGLPLGGNPRAIKFWDPVVEKVENRLQKWKRACLSKGGRLTMIQAVLCSIPIYYMSLFRIPIGVANRIEKLMRDFLWEGLDGKSNHAVSWEVVGKAKFCGGLGVGSLRARSVALRAKWLWRFPNEPHALWHKVIRSIYGMDTNG
ncbi:PREDICTED: RNA-directed DNA polymerase, partial [Prunus dulcis]